MSTEKNFTVADAALKNWLDKKQFAEELDVEVNNLNQILMTGPKQKKFPKAGPSYKQIIGNRALFSPQYVELVKGAREGVQKRTNKTALHHAYLTITVPIFEKEAADFLLKKFGGEEGIDKFLREKLNEVYKPTLARLAEIEAEYLQKKADALAGNC